MDKIKAVIDCLGQPSTVKGLIGLAGLAGWMVSPEQYQTLIEGLAVVYFLIAIFWQKS